MARRRTSPGSTGSVFPPLRRAGRRGGLRSSVAGAAGRRRLGRRHLADGVRRTGLWAGGELRRARGAGACPGTRARRAHRGEPGRADAPRPRHARRRSRGGCQRSFRRGAVVPTLQRARRRIRPRLGANHGQPRDEGVELQGTKVWTSYAQFADWGVCLARSDPDSPKHRGLSFFVVDMNAPGVQVHPLVQLTGEAEFNEVELDGVFVPDDQVVGSPGQGWVVAGSTLVARARGEPAPARHPPPAPRRAASNCRRGRRLRRSATAAASGPGLCRGAVVPAPQLALAVHASSGGSSQGPRAVRSSCTGAR